MASSSPCSPAEWAGRQTARDQTNASAQRSQCSLSPMAVAAVAADAAEAAAAAALPTRVRAAATRRSWSARKRAGGRWKLRWPFVALGVAALGASFAITAVSLLIAWREADTEEVAAEEEE